ncbi:MAG: hypothetical protein EB015_14615 [Methylocystaceae bacterium]|jgi:hypothetical protein|nr:hypothetical protein [Methylocystaceae bacterium]
MRFAKALASGIFDGGRSMAGSIAAVVTRSSPDDHNVLSYLFSFYHVLGIYPCVPGQVKRETQLVAFTIASTKAS